MKSSKNILFYLITLLLFTGCHEDMDDVLRPASSLDVKNFIWRGMNNIYLYKADVPDLSNTRFANQQELDEYLETFESPEDLFYNGLVADQDEFSFLVDDYIELEKLFDGIEMSNGMHFGLRRYPSSSSQVIGYVLYVQENSSAEENGVMRGDIFNTIDGQQITADNYTQLLNS